jgi:hypothetical protein
LALTSRRSAGLLRRRIAQPHGGRRPDSLLQAANAIEQTSIEVVTAIHRLSIPRARRRPATNAAIAGISRAKKLAFELPGAPLAAHELGLLLELELELAGEVAQ